MHINPVLPDVERAVEGSGEPFANLRGDLGAVFHQNREFIPTHARDGVAGADARLDPRPDAAQQFFAGGIAQRVIDDIEIVDSDPQQADRDRQTHMQLHSVRQPLIEQPPIRQAGHRVPQRGVGHRIEQTLLPVQNQQLPQQHGDGEDHTGREDERLTALWGPEAHGECDERDRHGQIRQPHRQP